MTLANNIYQNSIKSTTLPVLLLGLGVQLRWIIARKAMMCMKYRTVVNGKTMVEFSQCMVSEDKGDLRRTKLALNVGRQVVPIQLAASQTHTAGIADEAGKNFLVACNLIRLIIYRRDILEQTNIHPTQRCG